MKKLLTAILLPVFAISVLAADGVAVRALSGYSTNQHLRTPSMQGIPRDGLADGFLYLAPDGQVRQTLDGSQFTNISSGITATTATNISAYQAALLQERTEITISSKGILNGLSATNNDGAMFGPDTPGTTTCGIQEAWNSINKGTEYGPRNVAVSLRFGDGNFFFTNCLVFSNNYTTSIRMEGNDLLSTRLVFAGTAGNTNTLWVRGGGNANLDDGNPALNLPMHFWARHLAFSSILENTNVLVCITNVSGFEFDQCRFVSWRSMTNNTSGSAVSVASVGNYPGPQGLVGLVAGNVNDHWGILTACAFQGLASGMYMFTDHLMVNGAKFAEVGTVGGLFENNLFPTTSPFSLGAGIIRNNGLDTHITDAHCYSTRVGMVSLYYGAVPTPDSIILDGFQTEGATYDLAAFGTNLVAFYLKDPRIDYSFAKVSTNGAGVFSLAPSALDMKTVLYGTGGLTNPSTNINAFAITSGTINEARLPGTFLWANNSVDGTITNANGGGVAVGTKNLTVNFDHATVQLFGIENSWNYGFSAENFDTGSSASVVSYSNNAYLQVHGASATEIFVHATETNSTVTLNARGDEQLMTIAQGSTNAIVKVKNGSIYGSGSATLIFPSTNSLSAGQVYSYQLPVRSGSVAIIENGSLFVTNTVVVTNGFFLPQLSGIPSVDIRSSSGNTNWLVFNLGGDLYAIKTNAAAASSYVTNKLTGLDLLSTKVAIGSAVSLTTDTAANVASLALGAGEWVVSGNVNLINGGGTTLSGFISSIGSTSATLATDGTECYRGPGVAGWNYEGASIPSVRITGPATVYLVTKATFAVSTCSAFGSINAEQVR